MSKNYQYNTENNFTGKLNELLELKYKFCVISVLNKFEICYFSTNPIKINFTSNFNLATFKL